MFSAHFYADALEKTLENTSYNSQIRQLRILAEAALTHYAIGSARLTLLSHQRNTTFRVDAFPRTVTSGDVVLETGQDTRYVLRLCDPDGFDRETLSSELQWLATLARDTDLVIPVPVLSRASELITSVQIEDLATERLCLLLRWVPGRFVDTGLTPTHFERVGKFQAYLHQQARQFNPPTGFTRPHWELMPFLYGLAILQIDALDHEKQTLISASDRYLLRQAAERVEQGIAAIARNSNQYGLIHGELQQQKYLFYRGNVHAIGFGQCHWNYYLFDIAMTLYGVIGRDDEEQMRQAFFRGYESVSGLPAHYEERLPLFTLLCILRQLNDFFHCAGLCPQGDTQIDLVVYHAYAIAWCEQFLSTSVQST